MPPTPDAAAAEEPPAQRRRPLFSYYYPSAALGSGKSPAATPVLDHIRGFVCDAFGRVFIARGLEANPRAWHLVLTEHMEALVDVMADLHDKLEENIENHAALPLPLRSWETMRPRCRLDDTCVDHMAAAVVAAARSSMMGVQGREVSECVEIDTQRASKYIVMGVLNTQGLRDLVSGQNAARKRARAQSRPLNAPDASEPGSGILEIRDGTAASVSEREALGKWLRPLVGKAEGKDAIPKLYGALASKELLILATHAVHTTLVHLFPQTAARPTKWTTCVYDTFNPSPKMDPELQRGLTYFLEETKLKEGPFTHGRQQSFIQQDGGIVCSLMAIIRLILLLTGETLDAAHWQRCAELIRVFFDLWLFLDAEDRGAVRKGYLEEALRRAVSSGAGAPSGDAEGLSKEIETAVEEEDVGWLLTRSEGSKDGGAIHTRARAIEHVRGRGCRFTVGQESVPLDVDWLIRTVPANGSCLIAAIARAFGRLTLAVLKQHPSLDGFDWTAVEAWADWGKRLASGEDRQCIGLRKRISRLLWDNATAIDAWGYMPVKLAIGRDITNANFRKALSTAEGLGMVDPGDDPVKQWAVALLGSATHCTEEAIRAVLATDFGDSVAILVVRRDQCDGVGSADRLHILQDLVPAKAKFAVGLYMHCASEFADDERVKTEAQAYLNKQQRAASKRRAPEGATTQPAKKHRAEINPAAERNISSELEEEEEEKMKEKAIQEVEERKIKEKLFLDKHNRSHFDEASIRNGLGGALVISDFRDVGAESLQTLASVDGADAGRDGESGGGGPCRGGPAADAGESGGGGGADCEAGGGSGDAQGTQAAAAPAPGTQAAASLPRQRPLVVRPGHDSLQRMGRCTHLQLALAMGRHARLGGNCPFNAMDGEVLRIILKCCEEPVPLHEVIRLDLDLKFTGLLPTWAFDPEVFKGSDASCHDRVASCIDRLHSFMHSLSGPLRLDDPDTQSRAAPHLGPMQLLSTLPGFHIVEGSADFYLQLFARMAGAVYVSVERGTGALVIDASCGLGDDGGLEWPETAAPGPRRVVLAPVVLDLVAQYMQHGDVEMLRAFVAEVHALLAKHGHRAVWLVRGVSPGTASHFAGSTWVTVQTEMGNGIVTACVLDPTTQTPNLSDLMLYHSTSAYDAFGRIFGDDGLFMQANGAAAHQQQLPTRTRGDMHALLNSSALMQANTGVGRQSEEEKKKHLEAKAGIAALISNGSLCEIAAAALHVHCFAVMVQYWIECGGGSGLVLDDAFRTWLEANPTPREPPAIASESLPAPAGGSGTGEAAAATTVDMTAMVVEEGARSVPQAAAAGGAARVARRRKAGGAGPSTAAATVYLDLTGAPSDAEEDLGNQNPRPDPRPSPLAVEPGSDSLQRVRRYSLADRVRRFTVCMSQHRRTGAKCLLKLLNKDLLRKILEYEAPGRVPFPEFMLIDMAQRFPRLLPDGVLPGGRAALQASDYAHGTARANSLVEWLWKRFDRPDEISPGRRNERMPLADGAQLESVRPGRFSVQEVGGIVLQYACRLLRVDFLENPGSIIAGRGRAWVELAACTRPSDPRYLVLGMHVPDTLQKLLAGKDLQVLHRYCEQLAKDLRRYDGSTFALGGRGHFRAVVLKKVPLDAAGETVQIQCTVADSVASSAVAELRSGPVALSKLPRDLHACLSLVAEKMGATFVESAAVAGPGQIAPDCLYFTILAQLATISGMPLPTDIEAWRMLGALLRCYAFFLLLQDMLDCDSTTVNMDQQFQLWLAHTSTGCQAAGQRDDGMAVSQESCAALMALLGMATGAAGGSAALSSGGAAAVPAPPPPPLGVDAISWEGYEGVLLLAKACPVSRAVERIISFNSGAVGSRHTVYGWARSAASLDTVQKRASFPVEKRASVVKRVMEYIASRLTASFVSEDEEYRQELSSWILDRFRPGCPLPRAALQPLDEALVAHGLLMRRGRSRAMATPLSLFARYRNLEDKCHACLKPKPELVCACGTGRCKECFGTPNAPPPDHAFCCLWCLEKFDTTAAPLLKPDPAVTLCWACGCQMSSDSSEVGCGTAARCRRCSRLYCAECIGVCSGDVTLARSRQAGPGSRKFLDNVRNVALIDCRGCSGTLAYAATRLKRLEGMVRGIFLGARSPLALECREMSYKILSVNAAAVHEIGDYIYQLYYCGQRTVCQEGLPLLLNVLCVQLGLGPDTTAKEPLDPAIGPFNFFHMIGLHELATPLMLEHICRAQVFHAMKKGEALRARSVQALQAASGKMTIPTRRPDRLRVGLFAYDLLKEGPLTCLVTGALPLLAAKDGLDVYLLAETADWKYPPAKRLAEFFLRRGRLITLPANSKSDKWLKKLLECELHVLVSFAGWTKHDYADVLHVLSAWVLVINWLSFAGLMHGIAHVTVAGPAVGAAQIACEEREPIASVLCYQAPQSDPYFNDDFSHCTREYFNIPPGFIMFFPGSTNRLREMSIELYLRIAQRIPGSCILLLDRPVEMRKTILDWVHAFNRTAEFPVDPMRIIFRPWMEDKRVFLAWIDAITREGGRGVGIDSFGAVSVHTGANDCMFRRCPFFTWWALAGAMPSRVAAEVVTAAGLGEVCVADSLEGVLTLIVNYQRDKLLQERLDEFMASNQANRVGFFDEQRIPDALHSIVEHYFAEFMRTRGDRKQLKDCNFPYARPVQIFSARAEARTATRRKLLREMGIEDDMKESAEALLLWLERELGAEFAPEIVGRGGSTVTLCAKHHKGGKEVLTAVKVATRGRLKDRLHNASICKEALCLWLWHSKMKHHAFKSILPEPHWYLKLKGRGASFHGISLPNPEGKVLPYLLREYIPIKFTDRAAQHTERWQQDGTLHDTFRLEILLPLFQALFWAAHKGLYLMGVKPDNVGLRTDGTLAFLDAGQGCVCPVRDSLIPRDEEGMVLLNRQCTSMAMPDASAGNGAAAKKTPKRGLRPGALLQGRPARQGEGGVVITAPDLLQFQRQMRVRGGLANNGGGGSMGFIDEDEVAARQALDDSGAFVRRFEPKHGYARDIFAAFRTVLFILTHRHGVSMCDWDAEALAAAREGRSGIRAMLLRAVRSGVDVQQTLALERTVNFVYEGLRPERPGPDGSVVKRTAWKQAMTDEMATLPILPPDIEAQLASGIHIGMPGGPLRDFVPAGFLAHLKAKDRDARLPALAFWNQPGMGMGASADEKIPGDAIAGLYVGALVENASIGRDHSVRTFPSRYTAIAQGVTIRGGTGLETKVACDAQQTAVRDFEWHRSHGIGGPYMNAASSTAEENCVLDRHSVWIDGETGLVWMLMRTKPGRPVAKGEFLMWIYSHTAGPGKLWSFEKRA